MDINSIQFNSIQSSLFLGVFYKITIKTASKDGLLSYKKMDVINTYIAHGLKQLHKGLKVHTDKNNKSIHVPIT